MGLQNDLAKSILSGDRGALARGITLIESRRPKDCDAAEELLGALLPHSGKSIRIGITGAPGVGKSTLIETLGTRLCQQGKRLAVLAVDPSSSVTGGSILGDKTRMDELSRHENAFIRPSPGGGTLGGVASRTQEAILLCEASGYEVVMIETIGTGQSEVAVHNMVDYFLVMLSPAAGDELQGIKRGVMELADAVFVHKADGELSAAAHQTAQQCMAAMQILHTAERPSPSVLTGSSLEKTGIADLWRHIEAEIAQRRASGALEERRNRQSVGWLDRTLQDALLEDLLASPGAAQELTAARERVGTGAQVASAAARAVLRRYREGAQ